MMKAMNKIRLLHTYYTFPKNISSHALFCIATALFMIICVYVDIFFIFYFIWYYYEFIKWLSAIFVDERPFAPNI